MVVFAVIEDHFFAIMVARRNGRERKRERERERESAYIYLHLIITFQRLYVAYLVQIYIQSLLNSSCEQGNQVVIIA